MILDIAQIALLEIDQKMQRKSSAAKVSISLCEGLAPNCNALASEASRESSPYRIVLHRLGFEERKHRGTLPFLDAGLPSRSSPR